MTKERNMTAHNKLARQVGGAIACLLALAFLLGLTACSSGQAQQPDQPDAGPAAAAPDEPAPREPETIPAQPEPAEQDPDEEEHDGFPEPEEDAGPYPTDAAFTQEEFDQLVADVLDTIVSEDMTSMEQARAVFDYVHNNIRYTGRSDKSDWMSGAYAGLTTGSGDCYTYYAVSRALLTALEIDNLPVERVGGKSLHFWNLVDCGGGWYHFDACPRSVKLPSFLSFMVTDEQVAEFTAMAGRNYYDFDGSLLPERATEIVTKTHPVFRTPEPEEEEDPEAADPNAGEMAGDPEPVLPPDDVTEDPGAAAEPGENGTDPGGEMNEDPNAPGESPEESPAEVWTEPPAEEWPEPELGDGDDTEDAGADAGFEEAG